MLKRQNLIRCLRQSICNTARHYSGPSEQTLSIVQDEKNSRRKKRNYVVEGTAQKGFTLQAQTLGGENAFAGSASIVSYSSSRVTSFLRATFLPSGYPNTVGHGYLPFVAWQSIANFCVAANAVISSTFLLYSVGLGAGAIPTAGAMNWVLKDGLGQMGTLLFGKAIAHNFDIHSKSWFFLSMVKLNVATGLEILTILMPQHFLLLGSLANSIKGLAFMANGSTRSVFNLSFARDNNIADITAKGTSQFICASMFGTVAGATLCGLVGQDTRLALGCYSLLAFFTMWSAFATVKTIPLATLNNTRLQLLCEAYLKAISSSAAQRANKRGPLAPRSPSNNPPHSPAWRDYKTADDLAGWEEHELESSMNTEGDGGMGDSVGSCSELERMYDEYLHPELPSPVELAAEDPPLPWLMGDVRILNPAIIVGRPLDKLLEKGGAALLAVLLSTFKLSRYLVMPCGSALNVVLHYEAKPRDICQAYLQACLLRRRMRQDPALGQAAALHACAVERMQSNEAATVLTRAQGTSSNSTSSSSSTVSSSSRDGRVSTDGQEEVGPAWHISREGRKGEEHYRGSTGVSSNSYSSSSSSSIEDMVFKETTGTTSSNSNGLEQGSQAHALSDSCSSSSSSMSTGRDNAAQLKEHLYSIRQSGQGTLQRLDQPRGTDHDPYVVGASLAANADIQAEGMKVTLHSTCGIGGTAGTMNDPNFWVASTGASSSSLAELRIALQDTLQTSERLTTPFMAALDSSGWQLGKIVVEANRRRAKW